MPDGEVGQPLEELVEHAEATHSEWQLWRCPACNALNTDKASPQCQNCGRDFLGRPGQRPERTDRLARPELRSDIAAGFTKDEYDSEFG